MQTTFSTRFTGIAFAAAAGMLWLGWLLLPVKLGTFFDPGDFAQIAEQIQFWIWTFRIHLFGMVMMAVAVVALASLVLNSEMRVLVWPGAAIITAGQIVGAIGAAFYYHHGAWGATDMGGKSTEEIGAFVKALRVDTEYITCLTRFGRVFTGLGFVLLGSGLIKGKFLPGWISWIAVAIGCASMGLTMLLPDQLSFYLPVFHILSAWLLLTGITIVRSGLRTEV